MKYRNSNLFFFTSISFLFFYFICFRFFYLASDVVTVPPPAMLSPYPPPAMTATPRRQ